MHRASKGKATGKESRATKNKNKTNNDPEAIKTVEKKSGESLKKKRENVTLKR